MMTNTSIDARKDVYISDLYAFSLEKAHISPYTAKNKWEVMSYETAETKGKMLIASGESTPAPITIKPSLEGWYRIYICMGEVAGLPNHIDVKLTDDEFPRTVTPCRMGTYCMWNTSENVEESFWKCADMTGQDITVSKPIFDAKYCANVFWFHFVPMSDEEVEAFKARKPHRHMIAHMDGDFHALDAKNSAHDFCKPIYTMKDSDVSIICQEVINDLCTWEYPGEDYVYRDAISASRAKYFHTLTSNRGEIYKEQIAYAHQHGIKMFAGHRMQLSNFSFPYDGPLFRIPFVDAHKHERCEARDGTVIDFLSYGYEAVQNFILDAMMESAKQGFDGVLNIWTRGIHLYFEKPVADRFKEKFGDKIDMRTLKEDDPRLIEVKSDIIVEFYRKVRNAFSAFAKENGKEEMKIYITGCFDVQSSLNDGIDIARLAKEGLIDGVIQTKMKLCEQTDDVLTEDGAAIDLARYTEKARRERMYDRVSGSFMNLLAEGTKAYREIMDKYGIDYYTEIQWETYKKPEEYVNGAKQVYSTYGCGLSLWDCYPNRTNILSEWESVSHLGDREYVLNMSEDPRDYHKICKVLSYNGVDVRYISPSWRG